MKAFFLSLTVIFALSSSSFAEDQEEATKPMVFINQLQDEVTVKYYKLNEKGDYIFMLGLNKEIATIKPGECVPAKVSSNLDKKSVIHFSKSVPNPYVVWAPFLKKEKASREKVKMIKEMSVADFYQSNHYTITQSDSTPVNYTLGKSEPRKAKIEPKDITDPNKLVCPSF